MEINPIGMNPMQDSSPLHTIRIDGLEIQQLESRYKDVEIKDEEWDKVVLSAANILSRCPHSEETNQTVTGLALGKVQSGKTLSYTSLIALAVDNEYRITVVLAGTKNPLLEQTYSRLVHDLDAQRLAITPFRNPSVQDFDVIHSILHSKGHTLLVILKNKKRIDSVAQLLNQTELKHFPILIIDDEGDEASLNTQFRRNRQSAIYSSILNLRRVLPHHAYIAYTATPQANLLISGLDALSPDFAELIEPGADYCGGAIFFGENRNNFLREISLLQSSEELANRITPDLKSAIATFFVGSAIRWLRSDATLHSMLIHTSNLRADHSQLKSSIITLLALWKEISSLPDSDPSSNDLYSLFQRAYNDLTQTVQTPPSWLEVRGRIKDEIWQTEVWMVNSLPLGKDPIASPFRLKNNIFVGGNMLGRGVTLKGLAVTYITRAAQRDSNADTLEQRARWFGYKKLYLDVCRIFLTRRLISWYTELLQHEDDFWDALRRNMNQGISVRDWPRMFRLDMETWQLRPTRPQVASFYQFFGQDWDVQNKVVMDIEIAAKNIKTVRKFIHEHPGEICRFGNVEHLRISGVRPDILISDLLSHINLEGTDLDKSYLVEYLSRLYLGNRLREIEILVMAKGIYRLRGSDDGRTINPMEGPSSNYPGDYNIQSDNVLLQLHFITVRQSATRPAINTTAFAFYIPKNPQYDLRTVVRGIT